MRSSLENTTHKACLYLTLELSEGEQPFLGASVKNNQQPLFNIAPAWSSETSEAPKLIKAEEWDIQKNSDLFLGI